ncbi:MULTISPECIES: VPA1269 family protein [Pseudomonas]|uniref:VPA1269 family protein n=1 Tax=Pseudomonas wuhanensis TaxID=2954098 RepID=A0ABY9GUK0_9PSED|nr:MULTISPECIES: VPA1269 family protein [unclassified Pseudomonas]WLI13589.1 VPA1269 family protein [Pseudomonas sp. FP603]WLI19482.1 VPA1269 family protein [Pseudomonas sp. FP607]
MDENENVTDQGASAQPTSKVKGVKRNTDITLSWVGRDYPQLATWRDLAVLWLEGETTGIAKRLRAFVSFFERYLVQQRLPLDPAVLLARTTLLPDFYRTACPNSEEGIQYNNVIHAFLHFVLLHELSEANDYGEPVVSPAFHNPVPRLSDSEVRMRRDESVHSPLPYGYIDELRQMLAAGPHFRDWHWAQSALGVETGQRVRSGPDWFEVTEEQIDRNDPDCVWREIPMKNGTRLEMWSPVRWVALIAKLIVPLRTFQVRMLDSGEADTWRYAAGNWTLNHSRLAQGNERRPLQQGVFRRSQPLADGEAVSAMLYINTNKTADIAKSGPEKGYVLPWFFGGLEHQDVFYWLEKLRNWQEHYNPIPRRTAWTELDGRHISAKSRVQLAAYPDSCFLFRLPESGIYERQLPLKETTLSPAWFRLLEALEQRLADREETHSNGTPIRFLPPQEEQNNGLTTLFPLHSLRVSLITALALEGQVPFAVLQKLVGHSRLIMTLYYTKPGATRIHDMLLDAAERLNANKEASIQNFLLDTEYDELLQKAICNNVPSLAAAIPQHPAARNLVGWMPMHHGLCLAGGNTSEIEDNGVVGGCYNGGPNFGSASNPKHGPVPGGSRNCVRCRWFVTEPHYMPALVAHFNTLAYHFDEARNLCLTRENELQGLKKQKAEAEDAGQPFAYMGAHRQAERVWESTMKRFSDLAEDLVACWRLIERCKMALEAPQGHGNQLVAAGGIGDLHIAFQETESELLQLAGVCENIALYPDLESGKAVFRRSQLLDSVLYRQDLPPMFMLLNEQEQLIAGNAFLLRLGQQMNPANPVLGQREVIRLIDAGESLSQQFDMDLAMLLPTKNRGQAFPAEHDILMVNDA